jgi:transketolase
MTTISILPESTTESGTSYRAVAGSVRSHGRTAGEALDALTRQLTERENSLLVIVQSVGPDQFFSADQQQRLGELMTRWRDARDAGKALPPDQQAELERLVDAEVQAAKQRADFALAQLSK